LHGRFLLILQKADITEFV